MYNPQSSPKGTLIYMSIKLMSKPRFDLSKYKTNEIKSEFIEIMCKKTGP